MDSRKMRKLRDEKYDEATRIAWSFRSGPKRKKNKILHPVEGITEARNLFNKLRGRLLMAGLDDKDTEVRVFFADPNFDSVVDAHRVYIGQSDVEDLEKSGSFLTGKKPLPVCIGLIGIVWSNKLRDFVIFERPFVSEPPRALFLLNDQAYRITKWYHKEIDCAGKIT
jgi:hypothetical protein